MVSGQPPHKNPWIARKRVFATGGSYGGYMVAWMNAHVEPAHFRGDDAHPNPGDSRCEIKRYDKHNLTGG